MSWPRLADLARLPLPGTDQPTSVRFTPDGGALTYLQFPSDSTVTSLWLHDLTSGERRVIAAPPADPESGGMSLAEQLERERRRTGTRGVTTYAWLESAPVPTLLVPMGGRAYAAVGDEIHTGVRPVAGVRDATAILGSPDGSQVAFVRDDDVWVVPMRGGELRRLTSDAGEGVINGRAEYAAAEELDRFDGMWWSTDSRLLAATHVDERSLPRFAIAHLGEERPAHESHRYPFAGGPNATVTLRILDPTGVAKPRDVALPMDPGDYLARVVPHPQGGWLAAVLPRPQRELRWLRVAPDGHCSSLWTESADPWLNLDEDTRLLPDGRALRSTERSGFRHLELRSADGTATVQLTAGEWVVSGVVHVDAQRDEAWFMATADGATERHLYRVPLSSGDGEHVRSPERITSEPGWHDVAVSRDGERFADTWSDLDGAPRLAIHERAVPGGGRLLAPPQAMAAALEVEPPELLTLTAADGRTQLHAALYRPARTDAAADATPPPCVVWVYGGPHAQYVKRAWDLTVHPLRQYLARAGAAVLVVDNRGSAYRGLQFEAPIGGALGSVEVDDQAAAVAELAERGLIDPARVGITGGSYGGFMTIRAMALRPDMFRVGVAVAPVSDWAGYDTAYTERYLGLPAEQPEAYARSSALEVAAQIRGSLLILHGAIDENVHMRHSVRMVAALQAIGRDVELVILPADRHKIRTAAGMATRDRRTVRHLLEGLVLPLPDELADG